MEALHHEYHLARFLLETDITVPTRNANNTSSRFYNGDANFDSNMVIILAALLFALICALGLNMIVRCALRCSRGSGRDQSAEEIAARLALRGLRKDELRLIPEVVYKAGLNIPATDCPICLGEFREGEIVRILPLCNHGFHVMCIDTWLLLHSSCPTCRQLLFEHSSICNARV